MLLVLLDELEKECAVTSEISAQLTAQLDPLLEIVPECPPNAQGIVDPRPTLPHALERLRSIGDVVRRTNTLLRETRRRLEV